MLKNKFFYLKILFIGFILIIPLALKPIQTNADANTAPTPTTPKTDKKKVVEPVFTAKGLLPDQTGQFMDNCITNGNCSLCAVIATFAYAIEWMMKIGVLGAFVMVTFYGIKLLASTGSPEKIKAAKSGIVGTLIGLVVLFSGWTIVNIVLSSIILGKIDGNPAIFGKNWSQFCPSDQK